MPERIAGMTTVHVAQHFERGFCEFESLAAKAGKFLEYRNKNKATESDESFQQFVVYIAVLTPDRSKWLYYSRKKMNESEDRLSQYLSVGFGGHVNDQDFKDVEHSRHAFVNAVRRELKEEIPKLEESRILDLKVKGWIRDTSNPVGRVHLGVYVECFVSEDIIQTLGYNVLPVGSFELLLSKFETWSQIVLEKEGIKG